MTDLTGNRIFFSNHFTVAGGLFIQPAEFFIKDFEALNKWLTFKGTRNFESFDVNHTMYVDFPKIIPIEIIQERLSIFRTIYKRKFPFSDKEDFMKHIFEESITYMERFLNRDLIPYGEVLQDVDFDFYFDNNWNGWQKLDFALPIDKDPESYKQYFRKAINIFEEFDYNPKTKELPLPTNKNIIIDQLENQLDAQKSGLNEHTRNEYKSATKAPLSYTEVALIYAYKGIPVTRENGQELAMKYGFHAKTSGEKLYQLFNSCYKTSLRTRSLETRKRTKNKIKRIEKILSYLKEHEKAKASDEIQILKNKVEDY